MRKTVWAARAGCAATLLIAGRIVPTRDRPSRDPSHLSWMGADPPAAADALKGAVHHVHANDTMLNAPVQATTSLLEKRGADRHSRPVLELRHARLRPRRAMVARLLLSSPDGGLRRLAVDRA
jgi:hypothetical protein